MTVLHGIYNYIPETNHVSRVYYVAAVPLFTICATCNVISPVKYVLYFYISTFRSTCAVANIVVLCSSFISCFPGMWLRYFLNAVVVIIIIIKVLSFHCAQFCSSTPLFQTPYSSMSVIASFQQTVSIKMFRIMTTADLSVCR